MFLGPVLLRFAISQTYVSSLKVDLRDRKNVPETLRQMAQAAIMKGSFAGQLIGPISMELNGPYAAIAREALCLICDYGTRARSDAEQKLVNRYGGVPCARDLRLPASHLANAYSTYYSTRSSDETHLLCRLLNEVEVGVAIASLLQLHVRYSEQVVEEFRRELVFGLLQLLAAEDARARSEPSRVAELAHGISERFAGLHLFVNATSQPVLLFQRGLRLRVGEIAPGEVVQYIQALMGVSAPRLDDLTRSQLWLLLEFILRGRPSSVPEVVDELVSSHLDLVYSLAQLAKREPTPSLEYSVRTAQFLTTLIQGGVPMRVG